MSLARQHRERFLAATPAARPDQEGGLTLPVETQPATGGSLPSLARSHRARIHAEQSAGEAVADTSLDDASPAERAAAQIRMRLTHDLRRLKEIQSIEGKIAAKREMLPEYADWIAGLLTAASEGSVDRADEVLPTIMIWLIDTGDYDAALDLADHVIAHQVPLPARYERTTPTLVTEEIAEAALKLQAKNEAFPIAILSRVNALTGSLDMHDQVRAKLMKALGVELTRAADGHDAASPDYAQAGGWALAALRRAFELDPRSGVKTRIATLEKALAPKDNAGS